MSEAEGFKVVPLVEELGIEGAIVPNRRGELYRLAAAEIERLSLALSDSQSELEDTKSRLKASLDSHMDTTQHLLRAGIMAFGWNWEGVDKLAAERDRERTYAENLEHELRRLRDVVGDEDAALIDAALAGNGNEIVPVRCACQETNGVLVCRAPAGAPGCRFDTVYNGNEKSRSENGAAKAVPSQSQSEVKP